MIAGPSNVRPGMSIPPSQRQIPAIPRLRWSLAVLLGLLFGWACLLLPPPLHASAADGPSLPGLVPLPQAPGAPASDTLRAKKPRRGAMLAAQHADHGAQACPAPVMAQPVLLTLRPPAAQLPLPAVAAGAPMHPPLPAARSRAPPITA